MPDVFIIGFQEIIPLTAKNIMVTSKNTSQLKYWDKTIQRSLDEHTQFYQEGEKYKKIANESLVGIYISIYVK
jgi:hypothetical protein